MWKVGPVFLSLGILFGCNPDSEGGSDAAADAGAGDAAVVDGDVQYDDCVEGAVTEACLCGGTVVTDGFCCSGVHQSDECFVPTCEQGAVTALCECGEVNVSDGFCCAEVPQNIACNIAGTTYFVSSDGSDTNSGLSPTLPWQTLTKVNEVAFEPGDQILFEKDHVFYGTLEINHSGDSSDPISFGSYGAGAKPIITGFSEITGWTSQGGGLYSAAVVSESQTNMVTIDGVSTGMGRTPDSTFLTYESANANISITDNGLGDSPNWTGAEIVLRKNNWTMNRYPIVDHTSDTITYSFSGTGQDARVDFGYFIQNDLRTVDAPGEWYHDTSTGQFYMFFGSVEPTSQTVRIATLDNLLFSHSNANYVNVEGLAFEGSIQHAMDFVGWMSEWLVIRDCDITFAGQHGMNLVGCTNYTITGNTIRHSGAGGVHAHDCGGDIISDNTLSELGLIPGAALNGMSAEGVYYRVVQLSWAPQQGLIEGNRIESTGYAGVYYWGDNVEVRNNFINHACMVLDDCGGIYTGGDGPVGRTIEDNIVLNSVGNLAGAAGTHAISEGIYLDESASDVLVRGNSVAYCSNSGIKLHKARNNTIEDNLFFANHQGIGFENWENTSNIYGNVITGNIFFAMEPDQRAWRMYSVVDDTASFGTSDNNYFARPIDDTDTIFTSQPSTGAVDRDLEGWRAFSGQDASSHKSPQAIANTGELQFEYNATHSAITVVLQQPMIDVTGAKYQGSIVLQPFTAVILMNDHNP